MVKTDPMWATTQSKKGECFTEVSIIALTQVSGHVSIITDMQRDDNSIKVRIPERQIKNIINVREEHAA